MSSKGYWCAALYICDVLLSHSIVYVSTGTPLPFSEVPEEVKQAFRSVYLPPVVDVPKGNSDNQLPAPTASTGSSTADPVRIAAADNQIDADRKRSALEMDAKQLGNEDTTPATTTSTATVSSAIDGGDSGVDSKSIGEAAVLKKKRRIAPVIVSPMRPAESLTHPSLVASIDGTKDTKNDIDASTLLEKTTEDLVGSVASASSMTQVGTAGDSKITEPAQKVKKRISPVRVGDAVALSNLA